MDIAADIEATLISMADERYSRWMSRYLMTTPGGYGFGDKVLGLRNGQVRMVVKETWKTIPIEDAARLARSQYHEVRMCGLLIVAERYVSAFKEMNLDETETLFNLYTSLHEHINNWDLVDLTAPKIAGNQQLVFPRAEKLMDEWIDPEGHTLWQQRISMVSTWQLTRNNLPEACLRRAERLVDSPHDLLHKAAGWMLREVWKKGYRDEIEEFLERNVGRMSSTMLSYACEQMADYQRHHWQKLRKLQDR